MTDTYLTTISANFSSFGGLTTIQCDGNKVATASIQSGVPNIPPFSNTHGSWKSTSDKEITSTGQDFNYPTATLPGTISRSDFRAIFDPENGIVKETVTLRTFSLKANPLKNYPSVVQTFTVTRQRIKPGQSSEGVQF